MLDSNSLYVYDEDGNEKKMTILFTFDSDETGNGRRSNQHVC